MTRPHYGRLASRCLNCWQLAPQLAGDIGSAIGRAGMGHRSATADWQSIDRLVVIEWLCNLELRTRLEPMQPVVGPPLAGQPAADQQQREGGGQHTTKEEDASWEGGKGEDGEDKGGNSSKGGKGGKGSKGGKGGKGDKGGKNGTSEEREAALEALRRINPVFSQLAQGVRLDMPSMMDRNPHSLKSRIRQLTCMLSICSQLRMHQEMSLLMFPSSDENKRHLCRISLAPYLVNSTGART